MLGQKIFATGVGINDATWLDLPKNRPIPIRWDVLRYDNIGAWSLDQASRLTVPPNVSHIVL